MNASKSRRTPFLVHDQVPFDMVLGRILNKEESIFVFNEPALALRQGKFTQGCEGSCRTPNRKNKLTLCRRASRDTKGRGGERGRGSGTLHRPAVTDANARAQLRQQKAASQAASQAIATPVYQTELSLLSTQDRSPYPA